MTACDWPLLGCDTCCDLDIAPDIEEATQTAAINWLWEATNRRYGNCSVEIRPCLNGCHNNYGNMWQPFRSAPGSLSWVNVGCITCGDSCSCSYVSQVKLPTKGQVNAVYLDGVEFDAANWRLDNSQYLVRLDGESWPSCQDLAADPPTWSVEFRPGFDVPAQGQLAAATLSCQIARRMCGEKCDLPSNATTVTRQGVTVTLDPTKATGLWIVDQWVDMVNKGASKVWSPDQRVTRMVPQSVESP